MQQQNFTVQGLVDEYIRENNISPLKNKKGIDVCDIFYYKNGVIYNYGNIKKIKNSKKFKKLENLCIVSLYVAKLPAKIINL